MAKPDDSIVGDLINFRGLVYAPLNENGVIFLFGKVMEDLNMYIEEIKPGFPDCIGRRYTGKGWERIAIEFEFTSSAFRHHKHDVNGCDVIVCWEHDWKDCPLEVIELKEAIKGLANQPILRPDKSDDKDAQEQEFENYFNNHEMNQRARKWFSQIRDGVKAVDAEIWMKVGDRMVSVYSPERTFVYFYPRKTTVRLSLFTRGQPMKNVKQFEFEKGGAKWGGLSVKKEADVPLAVQALTEAHKRIKQTLKANEPTGWYAMAEAEDEEREKQ